MEEPSFVFAWSEEWILERSEVIPWKELREGIKLSLENAARLKSDSDLLLSRKRYASAMALLVLTLEELGKAVLLLGHYKDRKDVGQDSWKEIFRGHRAKQTAIFRYRDLLWHEPDTDNTATYEKLKGLALLSLRWTKEVIGFYVNWVGKRKGWACPRNNAVPLEIIQYLRFDVSELLPFITKHVKEIRDKCGNLRS